MKKIDPSIFATQWQEEEQEEDIEKPEEQKEKNEQKKCPQSREIDESIRNVKKYRWNDKLKFDYGDVVEIDWGIIREGIIVGKANVDNQWLVDLGEIITKDYPYHVVVVPQILIINNDDEFKDKTAEEDDDIPF